jgi:integrase
MAIARITKQLLDGLKPGVKDAFVWDSKLAGFGVKVTPSGSKVFIYQYRLGGRGAKVRRFTIGKFGPFTPDGARREAEHLARLVAQGTDPQDAKAKHRRDVVDLAFDRYVDRFETDYLKREWPASYADARATLDRFAVPALKSKPLPAIDRRDLRAVLKPVQDKPATARKLFAILRRLFNFAVSEDDIAASPMVGMERPSGPASRDRVLEDWELKLVWQASHKLGSPFGPLVRLLILTGARREEVAGMSWAELRQDAAMWHLPAERSKKNHPLDLPLSSLAVKEIASLKGKGDRWPRTGLLFSTTGQTPVSGFSRAKAKLDAEIAKLNDKEPLAPWRLHDLRRTLATGMQRLGVRFEVTEAILNHLSGAKSGIAGVYQRHHWADEKRTAIEAWASHVAGLLVEKDNSNLVALRG